MNIRCYKCGSKNVSVSLSNESKYSVGKGAVGTLLFGTGGAAMGVNGKNSESKRFICQACGEVATFSMNADTCAGIEKALRENDESALEIKKRFYPNIEWEKPTDEVVKVDVSDDSADEEKLKLKFIRFMEKCPNHKFDTKSLAEKFGLDYHYDSPIWDVLFELQISGIIREPDLDDFSSPEEFKKYDEEARRRAQTDEIVEFIYYDDLDEVYKNVKKYEQRMKEAEIEHQKWQEEHKEELEKKRQEEEKKQQEADEVFYQILKERFEKGKLYRVIEIIRMLPVEMSSSKIIAKLRRLMSNKKVVCIVEKKNTYYALSEEYYLTAVEQFENAETINKLQSVKQCFEHLGGYMDSENYISKCDKKISEIKEIQRKKAYDKACGDFEAAKTIADYQNLSKIFKSMDAYECASEYYCKCNERINYITTIENRKANKLCQHCGGNFKGLFTKICKACGKQKDY